jgi:hypothetical protein
MFPIEKHYCDVNFLRVFIYSYVLNIPGKMTSVLIVNTNGQFINIENSMSISLRVCESSELWIHSCKNIPQSAKANVLPDLNTKSGTQLIGSPRYTHNVANTWPRQLMAPDNISSSEI